MLDKKGIFRPHRGSSTTMRTIKANTVLENGELFVEYPDNLTGDNQYKVKIGNGVDTYNNLKYAIDTTGFSEDLNEIHNFSGVKNLLPNDALSKTMNGVTFIVNPDGSVTANGTSTTQFAFNIFDETHPYFEEVIQNSFLNKRLIVSGCPEGGGRDTYSLNLYRAGSVDGSGTTISERGTEIEFTWLNDLSVLAPSVQIVIRDNVTLNNVVFRPMIRLASIKDKTYVPYAMTNRVLTDVLLKVYRMTITFESVTAGQNMLLGNISTLTEGRILDYDNCMGILIISFRGNLGYDIQASVFMADNGDVIFSPFATQNNAVLKLSFFYY